METEMPIWECVMRARLEKEVEHGAHQIGTGDFIAWTGKDGYINYLIEIERAARGESRPNKYCGSDPNIDSINEMFKSLESNSKNGNTNT